jgi:hypothetical protein
MSTRRWEVNSLKAKRIAEDLYRKSKRFVFPYRPPEEEEEEDEKKSATKSTVLSSSRIQVGEEEGRVEERTLDQENIKDTIREVYCSQ